MSTNDAQIDEIILSNVEGHWRKVAQVIGRTAETLCIDENRVAKRIEILVKDGRLEAQGYIQYWRLSEVRLPKAIVSSGHQLVVPDGDSPPIQLTKAEMIRTTFPGLDAMVAFVPKGQQPSADLERQLYICEQSRWLPKDGGHVVMMPYRGEELPSGEFEVKLGGWDYEECDGCNGRIMAGEECWVTTGEIIHLMCDTCYQELRPS